jgi:hypothetical protein
MFIVYTIRLLQDRTASTLPGACTVAHDVTDFLFHSYFSFMDDLIEKMGDDEKPVDIKYVCILQNKLIWTIFHLIRLGPN